jgi:hypothetical protein
LKARGLLGKLKETLQSFSSTCVEAKTAGSTSMPPPAPSAPGRFCDLKALANFPTAPLTPLNILCPMSLTLSGISSVENGKVPAFTFWPEPFFGTLNPGFPDNCMPGTPGSLS